MGCSASIQRCMMCPHTFGHIVYCVVFWLIVAVSPISTFFNTHKSNLNMDAAYLPGQSHHHWKHTQDGLAGQKAPAAVVASDW